MQIKSSTPLTATLLALLLASAAGMIVAAVILRPSDWPLIGFEAIVIVTCATGFVPVWRARRGCEKAVEGEHAGGPTCGATALALACIAGVVAVASILGYKGTSPPVIGPFSLMPWVLARLGACAVLGAIGAAIALGHDRRAWRRFTLGLALGLPVLAVCAVFLIQSTRDAVNAWFGALPGPILAGVALLLFLLFTSLLAASVHLAITAFAPER